ncbi:prostasin-like [Mya arenaria]|uniref:prostasin-like n=1 Tax=Mya arenaria TaxID=6604 RepID=UPI0022E5A69D|nr:prostasin-like [Mya arenaria]
MELVGIFVLLSTAGWVSADKPVRFGVAVAEDSTGGDASRNIVGGKAAYKGEFPHHVAIYLDGVYKCGGTILDEKHVLTSAYCFYPNGTDNGEYQVKAGLWRPEKPDSDVQVRDVLGVVAHPKFNVSDLTSPDVAVVRVNRDFTFNQYVGPAAIPKTREEEQRVRRGDCALVGFGVVNQEKLIFPKRLRKIEGLILPNYELCYQLFEENGSVPKTMMCTSNPQQNGCRNDGGGALVCRKPNTGDQFVVGVLSFVSSPCRTDGIAYYPRVYRYRPWIQKAIKRLEM